MEWNKALGLPTSSVQITVVQIEDGGRKWLCFTCRWNNVNCIYGYFITIKGWGWLSKLQLDFVTAVRGGAIWWMRTKAKGRHGVVCRLNCDPCLSALRTRYLSSRDKYTYIYLYFSSSGLSGDVSCCHGEAVVMMFWRGLLGTSAAVCTPPSITKQTLHHSSATPGRLQLSHN